MGEILCPGGTLDNTMTLLSPAIKRRTRPDGECLIWILYLDRHGYGRFRGKPAHRHSYTLHFGDIPSGMCVLHKCDNPACVNPDHLFLGTHRDNTDDKVAKGRHRFKKGDDHGMAKMTANTIQEIKEALDKRETKVSIAARLGLSQRTIRRVQLGEARRE